MTNALSVDVRRATTWSVAISLLMIVSGLIAIGTPMIAGVAVTIVVGWLLILSAVLHLAFAWRSGHAAAVVWEILLGGAYGFIGFYVLANPVAGLESLTFAVAVYLVAEGVLECLLSLQLHEAPGRGWLLVDGVVTLIIAVMIWSTWPSNAGWVVGTLVGISMFFSGVTRLMLSLAIRRALV